MSKKLLYYILILIGAWFLWDYTRHRHTEMWWFKRFLSYPGIRPSASGLLVHRSVEMAFKHLQRLKKYHPEKIRSKLSFEKETPVPVFTDWFHAVPLEYWWVDIKGSYNEKQLNVFQKQFVKRMEAIIQFEKKKVEIRKKYEDGNVE